MNANEYQELAMRTMCDQSSARDRVAMSLRTIQLTHSAIGLASDAGELCAAIEHHIYYGAKLDETNVKEELGDCLWYIAEACSALGFTMEEVMEANIRKLRTRYPERFDQQKAAEENRDRTAERQALEAVEETGCCGGGRLCPTSYRDESSANFIEKQTGSESSVAMCPTCRNPLSDAACVLAAERNRPMTCPNCLFSFHRSQVLYG